MRGKTTEAALHSDVRGCFLLYGITEGVWTMQYLIMCRSLTVAQKAALLLERKGIDATVTKAPQNLRNNGCGYALRLNRSLAEAAAILKKNNVPYGKIYKREENKDFREVMPYDISG